MAKRTRKSHGRTPPHELQHLSAPGTPPGTLTVDPEAPKPVIRVMAYGPDSYMEVEITDPTRLTDYLDKHRVTWVDIDGLGDEATLRKVGQLFEIHPLALEDVVNVHQRPKIEEYFGHLFLVCRQISLVREGEGNHISEHVETEQLSLFLGTGFLLTFQERPGDCLDPVRERIRTTKGRVRTQGVDYLAYALIDATIDHVFPVLERFGEWLEALEDEVLAKPTRATMARIHDVKRELLVVRRAMWPLREVLNTLIREEAGPFSADTRLYLRDAYDHVIQVIDVVETYRELASGLIELYMSSVSNRMNDVMKMLTIISTIFIPLTFIVGVYGMNFEPSAGPWSMPELKWQYGYVVTLGGMGFIAALMVYYFVRKGWLGRQQW